MVVVLLLSGCGAGPAANESGATDEVLVSQADDAVIEACDGSDSATLDITDDADAVEDSPVDDSSPAETPAPETFAAKIPAESGFWHRDGSFHPEARIGEY